MKWSRTFKPFNRLFIPVAISDELWHHTLKRQENRLTIVFGLEVEQDKDDPDLKVWVFTLFGLRIGFGMI